ncbi:ribonuclease H-like domain-containing protein [Powellomyces hirtus]|nr:ribonuclease H-like domain-containing protein [Powellomyces hirtus]
MYFKLPKSHAELLSVRQTLPRRLYVVGRPTRDMTSSNSKPKRVLPWQNKQMRRAQLSSPLPAVPINRCQRPVATANEVPIETELDKLHYEDDDAGYQIIYVKRLKEVETALEHCKGKVMGFDIEWRVTYQAGEPSRPVALIQLCNDRHIGLFHIFHMEEFPDSLREVLENSGMTKVGLNIKGDALKLHRDFGVRMEGCLDLQSLVKSVMPDKLPKNPSLRKLTEIILDRTLDKTPELRVGNWERKELWKTQKVYAANDAYAGFKSYTKIMQVASNLPPQPPPALFSMSEYLTVKQAVRQRQVNPALDDDYFGDDTSSSPEMPEVSKEAAGVTCRSSQHDSRKEPPVPATPATPTSLVQLGHESSLSAEEVVIDGSPPSNADSDWPYSSEGEGEWGDVMDNLDSYVLNGLDRRSS